MQRRIALAALTGLLVYATACAVGDDPTGPQTLTAFSSVTPTFAQGNPTCGEGFVELKVEPVNAGDNAGSDGFLTVNVNTPDDLYFDWTASAGIDQVIVKGGPNANIYAYDPEATSDQGLHAPINANNGQPFGISHVSFCYDVELQVDKSVEPAFTRSHEWSLDKTPDVTQLTVAPGVSYPLGFSVGVSWIGATDSGHALSGTITVTNPHPSLPASVTGVADAFDGQVGDLVLDCPAFPVELGPGASLTCDYEGQSDGSDGMNTATATSGTAGIGDGVVHAPFAFVDPTSEVDACVTVEDSMVDLSGVGAICAGDVTALEPVQILYAMDVLDVLSVEECDQTVQILNIASNYGDGVYPLQSKSATVDVHVVCGGETGEGCTLTQGYWKTHSSHGPAPEDQSGAWPSVGGPDAPFFGTDATWYEVFWMPVRGNAAIGLAHQYMAAVLNHAAGAGSTDEVDAAMAGAVGYFGAHGLDAPPKSERPELVGWAGTLGAYNEGSIGPGHCDD